MQLENDFKNQGKKKLNFMKTREMIELEKQQAKWKTSKVYKKLIDQKFFCNFIPRSERNFAWFKRPISI